MAKPRIFISSTYYDQKQVRIYLADFIRELGYTPILSERGQIAYGSGLKLEEYCYKEVSQIDMLVSIIGGRFGSESQHAPHSVSQMEIKTAHGLGKQIYIFIDRSVHAEYRTYKANKGNSSVKYAAVDDPRIYEFIEYVENLGVNNTIHPFDAAEDIVSFLREQWAGLLHRFLQEASQQKEARRLEDLQATARTLQELVQALLANREGQTSQLREIALSSHPLFGSIRKLLGVRYRVFFTTKNEMADWLTARGMKRYPRPEGNDEELWIQEVGKDSNKKEYCLSVKDLLFDNDGRLRPMTSDEWKSNLVQYYELPAIPDFTASSDDDDIPF